MRIFLLVIDSFGMGALPDACDYGDEGANTALHICQSIPGPKWPFLRSLGLGNAGELLGYILPGCEPVASPLALYGVMAEKSPGKDTTTGHWEMAGIILDSPFTVFPGQYPSFPEGLVSDFIHTTGCGGILGNKAASGTEIIEELGTEHLRTGFPICYTSADSVFQIAAHKSVIPLERLYQFCEKARKLCDPYRVGRVIARPFEGQPGSFKRTQERHDYSIALPQKTLLDHFSEAGISTIGVGKIGSIFNEQGLSQSYHDAGNEACLERTHSLVQQTTGTDCLVFVNLVDTDMIYGHRRDIKGYFQSVTVVDETISQLAENIAEGDILVITGDHGCDPSFKGTDHTREYVPALIYRKGYYGKSWGIRDSFADLAEYLSQFRKEMIPRKHLS